MKIVRLSCLLVALFPAACGSSVTTPDNATASGTGGAASSASAVGSTSSQATTGIASSATSSSSASTGVGGASACDMGYIDIDGAGPTQHFVGSCPNGWGANESAYPVAYFESGGAILAPLSIAGCLQSSAAAPAITITAFSADSTTAGTYNGVLQFTDASGAAYFGTEKPASIVITKITEMTGGTVEGSFQGDVAGPMILSLSGTFRACKVDDEILP